MEDEGAMAIANALHDHPSLRHLDLGDNIIGDDGAMGLAKMLRSNSVLRKLRLYMNCNYNLFITEKGRKALGCAMEHNRTV
mmetsp:Transcript_32646/g.75108  ORF Transcript_32646/g.75108 Transcript_32646/m.75108 type:complete len:81 (+) Transcript_32646:47-289(+)